MDPNDAEKKFRRGLDEFNHRRFFDAHETWEEIWLPAPEPEKTFLQGIIQVAAAFHHYSRDNCIGAQSLLEAGLKKLDQFPETHRGLALEELRVSVRQWIEALITGNDPGQKGLPRIEPADSELPRRN